MEAQHLAGQIVGQREAAIVQVDLDNRAARVVGGIPDPQGALALCKSFRFRCGPGCLASSAAARDLGRVNIPALMTLPRWQAHRVPHVIAARLEGITCEGVNPETLRVLSVYPDAEAAIMMAVAWARNDDALPAQDGTAHRLSDDADIEEVSPEH
ncbi:hypothetical protein [Methylobacterium sp. SyP6R]|uniref:hypothetical protein n=1 Tax=Methylobacterium sp. SyP6R TaxID=2718876 RepID=UPI001F23F93F|nr:hypothetical protein [Methylobacterium sp. SyP6R]MCF4123850.1 hypothetical protein [Methylobacterium sp. SyP6R]